MIEILSLWAKNLGVTIVIVSILEMILPNNKTKKYIRMILGIFLLFNIVSPLIQNKDKLKINEINFNEYQSKETLSIDQTSMDERIKELSEKELEKEITNKLKEKGYIATKCKVTINDDKNIELIKINIQKLNVEDSEGNESVENDLVKEIEKVKKIDTKIEKDEVEKITREDIKNVKKTLIEEYEVNEKCLEIN